MATDVLYNGVMMHNVITRAWEQDIEYDESGTDNILSRFRLEFEGVIHIQTVLADSFSYTAPAALVPYALPGSGAAPNASAIYQQVRTLLHEPRGLLLITFNGTVALRCLWVANGADPDADVENGPKPRLLSLEHIAHDQLFRVKFAVECAKTECGTAPQGVLNNRWGVIETMDANFKTTRTIRGKIRISQSMADNLHSFKPMIVPTLEAGFRRETIDFAALPNGLEADYTVVDKQVTTAAPWPATTLRASFEESNETNTAFYSQIHVRLEGPANADKRIMMARAVQIAEARLGDFGALGNATNQNVLIENIALAEDIGEDNAIEFRCRLRRTPDPSGSATIGNLPAGQFGMRLKLTSIPTPYDPAQSPVPSVWGYSAQDTPSSGRDPAAVLYALRCYLQSPCSIYHAMQQPGNPAPSSPKPQSGAASQTTVSATQVSQLPAWQPPSLVSVDAKNTLFFFARGQTSYKKTAGRAALPIAGDVGQLTQPSVAFVSLGRPVVFREITVDGERLGSAPKMPPPLDSYAESGGNMAKLLDHHVELFPPTLSVDGAKKIFRARGYYRYALSRAPQLGESLIAGSLPFTAFGTTLSSADLYDAGLGPQAGAGPSGPSLCPPV